MQIKQRKKIIVGAMSILAITCGVFYYQSQQVDTSKLEMLMKEQPKYKPVVDKVVHEQRKPVEKKKATEDDVRFLVSRDFNVVMACQSILSNSLNPDIQKEWISQRMALVSQRERTRASELALQEQQSNFQALQLKKKQEALTSTSVNSLNFFGDSTESTVGIESETRWPKINLISISKVNKATFTFDGKLFVERAVGEVIDDIAISKVEAESGCLSFLDRTQVKRVCL